MKKLVIASFMICFASTSFAMEHGKHNHKGGKKSEKKFQVLDNDGDGVISHDEFIADAEARFAKMDADGNKEISLDELISYKKSKKADKKLKKANKRHEKFKKMDQDGNGEISIDELEAHRKNKKSD